MPKPGKTSKSLFHKLSTPPCKYLALSQSTSPSPLLEPLSRQTAKTWILWTNISQPWIRGRPPSRKLLTKSSSAKELPQQLLLKFNYGDPEAPLSVTCLNNSAIHPYNTSRKGWNIFHKLKTVLGTGQWMILSKIWNISTSLQPRQRKMLSSWPHLKGSSKTLHQKKGSMLFWKLFPVWWMVWRWFGLFREITRTFRKCKNWFLWSLMKSRIKFRIQFKSQNFLTWMKKHRKNFNMPKIW